MKDFVCSHMNGIKNCLFSICFRLTFLTLDNLKDWLLCRALDLILDFLESGSKFVGLKWSLESSSLSSLSSWSPIRHLGISVLMSARSICLGFDHSLLDVAGVVVAEPGQHVVVVADSRVTTSGHPGSVWLDMSLLSFMLQWPELQHVDGQRSFSAIDLLCSGTTRKYPFPTPDQSVTAQCQ